MLPAPGGQSLSVRAPIACVLLYQRVSPDCFPHSNGNNGKKPSLRPGKEDDADGKIPNYSPSFDAKPIRPRSASVSANASTTPDRPPFPHFPDPSLSENQLVPTPKAAQSHHDINGVCSGSGSGSGNVLLQWGHNKRSRGSRAESRAAAADEPSAGHSRQVIKIQRRAAAAVAEKLAAASAMPPPGTSYTRGANLRPCTPVRDVTSPVLNRSVDERSGGQTRPEKRSPPSPPEKAHKAAANGVDAVMNPESKPVTEQDGTGSGAGGATAGEKLNLDHFEWPRIYVSLSRKEKEDDFLAMKGTKLPQRPKKRAKNVDKTLQYCFPGMWLSDLTRGRYEVREKKCVKKKRRGLKGMESMDSDSE